MRNFACFLNFRISLPLRVPMNFFIPPRSAGIFLGNNPFILKKILKTSVILRYKKTAKSAIRPKFGDGSSDNRFCNAMATVALNDSSIHQLVNQTKHGHKSCPEMANSRLLQANVVFKRSYVLIKNEG